MRKKFSLHRLIFLTILPLAGACSAPEPKPFGPVPTEAQLAWQRMEINMFCHFGPNTFTGAEWGSGQEREEVFHPRALDCCQWVDVAQQAGMGGIILTAKHHDGFCLWTSAFSTHTVPDSLDILRAFVDACKGKVKAGVYISPWDRNHPAYGTEEYNAVFANTLREVHSQYGPFFEQWFDGACGEGPNGKKQHYDWPKFMQTILELNPGCIIFSDIGPGCRWVGNEEGRAGETCWSTLNTEGATPSENKPSPTELETGHPLSILSSQRSTPSWVPAEVDVSIRPGWFWHANEHPKTVDELMEIYYNSVGRNGLLLINVPPDTNGRISPEDSAVLVAFRAERDRIFSKDLAQGAKIHATSEFGRRYAAHNMLDTTYHTYWASGRTNGVDTIYIDWDEPIIFDLVMLQEYIPLGQRIGKFEIFFRDIDAINSELGWYPIRPIEEKGPTTIGYKRIVRCWRPIHTRHIKICIESTLAPPILNRIALFNSKAQ